MRIASLIFETLIGVIIECRFDKVGILKYDWATIILESTINNGLHYNINIVRSSCTVDRFLLLTLSFWPSQ